MYKIDILIVAFSYNKFSCEEYINLVIETYYKLADKPEELRFIIGLNSEFIDLIKLTKFQDNVKIEYYDIRYSIEEKNSIKNIGDDQVHQKINTILSRSHSQAINYMMKFVKSEYFMTQDNDCFCLRKGWDKIMKSYLIGDNIIIGTGNHKSKKNYQKNPYIISAMYKTDACKNKLDFTFGKHSYSIIKNKKQSEIYNLKIGTKRLLDIGSQIPLFLSKNNYKGIYMKALRLNNLDKGRRFLSDELKEFLNKSEISNGKGKCEEYHFKKKVFCVHLAEGRYREIGKDIFTIHFMRKLKKYFKNHFNIVLTSLD